MSLLGKIGGALKGALRVAAPIVKSPVAKFIPGLNVISTGLTVAGVAGAAYSALKPKLSPTPPMFDPGAGAGGGLGTGTEFPLAFIQDRIKANGGPIAQAPVYRDMLASGQITIDQAEQSNWQLLNASPPPMMAQAGAVSLAGAVPGWGNLAARGGAVIAGAIKRGATKWVPAIINGVAVWQLVDAVGNVLDIRQKKPSRRMNPLNPRALSRAHRRMDAFRGIATRELKHYGYSVSRTAKPKSKKRRRH